LRKQRIGDLALTESEALRFAPRALQM